MYFRQSGMIYFKQYLEYTSIVILIYRVKGKTFLIDIDDDAKS